MIGSELAPFQTYLLERAASELDVRPRTTRLRLRLAESFVRVFGVPEIGLHVRIGHVLGALPDDVGALVDLGCGAGALLGAVKRRKRYRRLVGLEIEPLSADVARFAQPDAQIVATAVETALLESAGFDTAACVDVLEHLREAELEPFLRRARALLAPSGVLIVHVPAMGQRRHFARFVGWGHHDHEREGFTREQLVVLLERSGFVVRSIRDTFRPLTSLAWEINMLAARTPLVALVFPLTLALAALGEKLPSRRGNALLCVAGKRIA